MERTPRTSAARWEDRRERRRPSRDLGEKGKTWTTLRTTAAGPPAPGSAAATVAPSRSPSPPPPRAPPSASWIARSTRSSSRAPPAYKPSWTIEATAAHWLEHKARYGKTPATAPSLDSRSATTRPHPTGHRPRPRQMRLRELTTPGSRPPWPDSTTPASPPSAPAAALSQMLDLAVRDGALHHNPMPWWRPRHATYAKSRTLDVAAARRLLEVVHPDHPPQAREARPNIDLYDPLRPRTRPPRPYRRAHRPHLVGLPATRRPPTLLIEATLVEPRKGWVEGLHAQPPPRPAAPAASSSPTQPPRPSNAGAVAASSSTPHYPILCSARGTFLWPNNLRTPPTRRTRRRRRTARTTPPTLRRTVGTLIAYEVGLDAARMQLATPSPAPPRSAATVAHRQDAPDLRPTLDQFFG